MTLAGPSFRRTSALALVVVASCYPAEIPVADPATPSPQAAAVAIRKSDPPDGSKELGPIEAAHGEGCGYLGSKGTYEGALIALRNKAAHRKGNYVQIMTITEPHPDAGCFDDRFVIRGILYRTADAEGPAADPEPRR